MTEEEAKTKWCPMARHAELVEDNSADVGTPRAAVAANTRARCIGSACMAWRWRGWANKTADGSLEVDEVHGGPYVMPHGPTQCQHGCVHLGFCGLAGKP